MQNECRIIENDTENGYMFGLVWFGLETVSRDQASGGDLTRQRAGNEPREGKGLSADRQGDADPAQEATGGYRANARPQAPRGRHHRRTAAATERPGPKGTVQCNRVINNGIQR